MGASAVAVTQSSPSADRSDDSVIMELLVAGDPTALSDLYDRYGRLAFWLAMQILHDVTAAEDVVQDVFVAVWKHAPSYDRTRGSARAWLLTSVRHRCIDVRRRTAPSCSLTDELEQVLVNPSGDVWESLRPRIEAEEVRRALGTLPEEQRATIYLAYYQGLTHAQIAASLRIPLGTVKGRIRLALDKLRASLVSLDQVAASAT